MGLGVIVFEYMFYSSATGVICGVFLVCFVFFLETYYVKDFVVIWSLNDSWGDLSSVYCRGERERRMACQLLIFTCLHMVVMHGMVQTSE